MSCLPSGFSHIFSLNAFTDFYFWSGRYLLACDYDFQAHELRKHGLFTDSTRYVWVDLTCEEKQDETGTHTSFLCTLDVVSLTSSLFLLQRLLDSAWLYRLHSRPSGELSWTNIYLSNAHKIWLMLLIRVWDDIQSSSAAAGQIIRFLPQTFSHSFKIMQMPIIAQA